MHLSTRKELGPCSLSAGVQNEDILLGKIKVVCPRNFSIGIVSRHNKEGFEVEKSDFKPWPHPSCSP